MTVARVDPTATLLADSRVLIAGGADCTDPACVASAEVYDPTTGKFTRTGSMTVARIDPTATLLPDGRVLLAQGTVGGKMPLAELYDPKSGTFSPTRKEILGSENASATRLTSGKVLLTAGAWRSFPSGAVYDEASGKFTEVSFALAPGAAPSAEYNGQAVERGYGPATVLKDGRVLLYEGWYLETYDPTTGACADAGFISPHGLWLLPTETQLSDGRVLFAGGDFFQADFTEVITDSAILYDPSDGSQIVGSLGSAREGNTSTLLPNGSVLIAGGADSNGNPLASSELLKP
jgi:hypothetical protein